MILEEKTAKTKDGRSFVMRSARKEDAEVLINYLKKTAEETPFLIREPEEITITLEQETAFINAIEESDRNLMLVAFIDGKHVGNCSISAIGNHKRYRHRCGIAIALLQEFWGLGIGRQMFEEALRVAKELGYEQVELEVHADNHKAIAMYKSFGFEIYGTRKKDMKFQDGTYADGHMMVKYF